ncbi:hypothetical protein [Saccharopolyspora pogona]|uniref:hypothetical protein n=1 Tax=Saccharopolyspora pogona TaxID=333966 RepID=UPI0016897F13|nr:hypothetical protein [Saccharopolyspora pogona]
MHRTIHIGAGERLSITRNDNGTWTLAYTEPGREGINVELADDKARATITWLLAGAMRPEITLE